MNGIQRIADTVLVPESGTPKAQDNIPQVCDSLSEQREETLEGAMKAQFRDLLVSSSL